MTLPELSIRRHVFAWMLSAVLVLFGIISYGRIGMDRYPYIEFPVVSVSTAPQGANPDIVDASITNVLESSVNSVPGIEHIQSTSSPGISVINITFNLERSASTSPSTRSRPRSTRSCAACPRMSIRHRRQGRDQRAADHVAGAAGRPHAAAAQPVRDQHAEEAHPRRSTASAKSASAADATAPSAST